MRPVHVPLVVLAMVAGVLFAAGTNAQDKGDPKKEQPTVKVSLPQGWSKLGISGEQKKKVYEVLTKYHTKIAVLKEQIETLKKEEYVEAYKLLNDDQKATLKKLADKGIGDDKTKDK